MLVVRLFIQALVALLLLQVVFAAPFDAIFDVFGGFDARQIYAEHGNFIDFVLVLAFFIAALRQSPVKDKIGVQAATILAIMLTVALFGGAAYWGFSLAALMPIALILLMLLLGSYIHSVFKQFGANGWVAFFLTFFLIVPVLTYVFGPDLDGLRTLSPFLYQLLVMLYALSAIALCMFLVLFLFSRMRPEEDGGSSGGSGGEGSGRSWWPWRRKKRGDDDDEDDFGSKKKQKFTDDELEKIKQLEKEVKNDFVDESELNTLNGYVEEVENIANKYHELESKGEVDPKVYKRLNEVAKKTIDRIENTIKKDDPLSRLANDPNALTANMFKEFANDEYNKAVQQWSAGNFQAQTESQRADMQNAKNKLSQIVTTADGAITTVRNDLAAYLQERGRLTQAYEQLKESWKREAFGFETMHNQIQGIKQLTVRCLQHKQRLLDDVKTLDPYKEEIKKYARDYAQLVRTAIRT